VRPVNERRVRRPRPPAETSKLMRAVRREGTSAELLLQRAMRKARLRFKVNASDLPGSPDVVMASSRLAIFVDGDFWHGRALLEGGPKGLRQSLRSRSKAFWIDKITRNVARDREQGARLRALGWRVIRLWEKDLLDDVSRAVYSIECHIRKKRAGRPGKASGSRIHER
jgi:DNA mismatch endonuclease (patch repair protein)